MYAITIDTGTTNTRVCAWHAGQVIADAFQPVGVRDTAITGSRQKLMQGVRQAILEARQSANIASQDDVVHIASGMITSNVGLYEVPHIAAPAGKKELAAAMVSTLIPEVTDQPIWFIPGVKTCAGPVTLENCEAMDIIRGEEVEIVGVTTKLNIQEPAILILPGSHSKIISVDAENRITGCITTLAGELLDVITQKTILANALQNSFAEKINPSVLLKGAQQAEKVGLGRTCFTVRILDLFTDMTLNDKANFLLGAVLGSDLLAVKYSKALAVDPGMPVIISGKKVLREALALLIKNDAYFKGTTTNFDDEGKSVAGFGALTIAKERGILK
jgi:2-dehydro-3-deoxygalactonokinase